MSVPKAIFLAVSILSAISSPLGAQAAEDADTAQKRTDILRYGVVSEMTALLDTLASEKNDAHNPEILAAFADTKDASLKQSIFAFFSKREWKGAEAQAASVVAEWADEPKSLVTAALDYGTTVRSSAVLDAAKPLFDQKEQDLLPSLVKLSGAAGGASSSATLIDLFKDDASSENLKEAIVQALGSSGGEEAVSFLIETLAAKENQKFARIYACGSLGKLADPRAIDCLVDASSDEDPNVRVAAIGALSSFDDQRCRDAIVRGLRDSFDSARIEAAKDAGKLRIAAAEGALVYKVGNDSNVKMRQEAMRSLAELGSPDAWKTIVGVLSNVKGMEENRLVALGLVLKKKWGEGYPAVREAFAQELKDKNVLMIQRIAQLVSQNENPELQDLAQAFMASSDFIVRAYGIDWVRLNKVSSLKAELERLSGDSSDLVKKRAAAALKDF